MIDLIDFPHKLVRIDLPMLTRCLLVPAIQQFPLVTNWRRSNPDVMNDVIMTSRVL